MSQKNILEWNKGIREEVEKQKNSTVYMFRKKANFK